MKLATFQIEREILLVILKRLGYFILVQVQASDRNVDLTPQNSWNP